jgi:hypothetical protein
MMGFLISGRDDFFWFAIKSCFNYPGDRGIVGIYKFRGRELEQVAQIDNYQEFFISTGVGLSKSVTLIFVNS